MNPLTGLSLLFAVVVGYTYAGYPVAVWLLARRRPRPRTGPALPTVTVIIAAYNEERSIGTKLAETLALDYPAELLDVIVAADGSDDGTAEIVEGCGSSRVRLSHEPARRGKSHAVDRAVPAASGEILVFSDANNSYTPTTIRELVAPFTDSRVGMVSGVKRTVGGLEGLGTSDGLYWRYESFIKAQEGRLGSCTAVCGEVFALRNGIVGPLPETTVLDDLGRLVQVLDAGYNVAYAPKAISVEPTMASMEAELERRTRSTAGRWLLGWGLLTNPPRLSALVWWELVSHKILRLFLPFAMLGLLVTSGLDLALRRRTGAAGRSAGALFGAQVLFYLLALVSRRVSLTGRAKVLYLPRYLVETNASTARGLVRALSNGRPELWARVPRFGEDAAPTASATTADISQPTPPRSS